MSMQVLSSPGTAHWSAHTAAIHVLMDWQQLAADAHSGAAAAQIAADKAALIESKHTLARVIGTNRIDITV